MIVAIKPARLMINKNIFKLVPLLLIVISFGPYLFPQYGIRSEHLVIYLIFIFAILFSFIKKKSLIKRTQLLIIVFLFSFIILEILIVTIFGSDGFISKAKVVAHIENFLQPVAIILSLVILYHPIDAIDSKQLFIRACHTLIFMLVCNTLLIISSLYFNLSEFIDYFSIVDKEGFSVSRNALTMGRFSGVFNQPSESGLTYSLGLLSWVYINNNKNRTSIYSYFILILLIIGGLASISKIFIYGGMIILIIYSILLKDFRRIFNYRFIIVPFLGVIIAKYSIENWSGYSFFMQKFDFSNSKNIIGLVTGDRFGTSNNDYNIVKYLFTEVWDNSPIYGFGFASYSIYDNAYLEFFVQGGIIALTAYLFILVNILIVGFKFFQLKKNEYLFLWSLIIVLFGGSIGMPVLTANRFSTIFWVFFVLLINYYNSLKIKPLQVSPKHKPLNSTFIN